MGRVCSVLAIAIFLTLTSVAEPLAQSRDSGRKCKGPRPDPHCHAVSVPEIDPAGGFIPLALLGGSLLLVAEVRRRRR